VPKTYVGEKTASLTNSVGKTEYPYVEGLKYIFVFRPAYYHFKVNKIPS
jgi:hypothetical protein